MTRESVQFLPFLFFLAEKYDFYFSLALNFKCKIHETYWYFYRKEKKEKHMGILEFHEDGKTCTLMFPFCRRNYKVMLFYFHFEETRASVDFTKKNMFPVFRYKY